MKSGLTRLIAVIFLYLSNYISGRRLVSEVDRLVAGDLLVDLPDACQLDFDRLHEQLASCVWDDETHQEFPGIYINEAELRIAVDNFIAKWGRLLAESI